MRKIIALLAGIVLASSAEATPTVTYTLSLNESASGTIAPSAFTVYATVSQGDNSGLFSFGVDLNPGVGGTIRSATNRSPNGIFEIDDTDPNWDPSVNYPTKYAGFGIARSNSGGAQDLSRGEDLIPMFGFG